MIPIAKINAVIKFQIAISMSKSGLFTLYLLPLNKLREVNISLWLCQAVSLVAVQLGGYMPKIAARMPVRDVVTRLQREVVLAR